ncbi:MAG: hypothetical protein AAFY67_21550 [Cyanobacteria bacterium J06642_9]
MAAILHGLGQWDEAIPHFEPAIASGPGGHQCALRPGMTGRTDIVTHEETVLTFLLRKAKRLTDL